MEYNPNIFWSYEQPDRASDSNSGQLNQKMLKQYGKFQRKNMQTGYADKNNALAVFIVASVLETKNKKILKEAKGLDDVLSVPPPLSIFHPSTYKASPLTKASFL